MKDEEILRKYISEKTGINEKVLDLLVQNKREELLFIDKRAALYIIAKELGINLKEFREKMLK